MFFHGWHVRSLLRLVLFVSRCSLDWTYYSVHHRRSATSWHQLVADDFHLEASGPQCRGALITFFVLSATAGVPLSWGKTAGGDVVTWVGFELLRQPYSPDQNGAGSSKKKINLRLSYQRWKHWQFSSPSNYSSGALQEKDELRGSHRAQSSWNYPVTSSA